MVDVTGLSWIDGIDLWTAFSMFFEKASTDLLKYAPKKDSITHDWMDSNGIDVDLSRYFFKERTITINCAIIADNEADFWNKHDSFIATLTQPGTRRLELKSHNNRSYFIFYKECNNYTQVLSVKGNDETLFGPNKVAAKFSIVVIEPNPQIDSNNVYIITEDGHFLIT